MILIEDTVVSDAVFSEEFVCNLSKCKGICCVEGDSGAPLEKEELAILQEIFPKLKPYLRPEGIRAIEEQGTAVIDEDGDDVTPLVNGAECAYVVFDSNGITKCGIEKAYENGAVDFHKPISCHLYPIRVQKYRTFSAVNYHEWEVCHDACTLGKELKVNVLHFLKTPLIRKFGEDWYEQALVIEQEMNQSVD